ncbi:MAG TPA: LysR substrate-binding domain-containing protein, partial [Acidiphilium sp.]
MEHAALTAERAITGRDVRLEGVVRVTAVEGFAEALLMPVFVNLAERFPGIVIELIGADRTLSLAAREADLAIRLARPRGQSILARRIGTLEFGFYASAGYLARHGTPDFAVDKGEGHRLLLLRDETGIYPEHDHMVALLPLARPAFRADSHIARRRAAEAGLGIACLARYSVAETGLMRIAAPDPPGREIWLAQHEDTRTTPRIRAVAEAIAAGLRERRVVNSGA